MGHFRFKNIPIGRYDIQVSYLGYEPVAMKEILLTSTKEVNCDIALVESSQKLEEVVVRARINKERPLNPMALTGGGRMISVEEANRFAGGIDDPARLVTSFADVAGVGGGLFSGLSSQVMGNSDFLMVLFRQNTVIHYREYSICPSEMEIREV